MKIVFLDAKTMGETPNFNQLEKLGNFVSYPLTLPNQRIERSLDAQVIITCKVIIDREIIDACRFLKLICVAATGTNNVDVDYAKSKGIQVKNVAGYSTESVAQIAVGMILTLTNKTWYYSNYVKRGAYTANDMFTHYGPSFYELKDKTLGIIGLGNIGSRVAQIMKAFGMNVIYYSTSGNNNNSEYTRSDLETLMKGSDVISVHCPLNDNTRDLITMPLLEKMKSSAIIINVARGGIINEKDLIEAHNKCIISGFGTDVYHVEPILKNSPYFDLKRPEMAILTPHYAWTSIEARTKLISILQLNIKSFIEESF